MFLPLDHKLRQFIIGTVLQAELRRIEAEEAQKRTEMDDELADARTVHARGEEISPLLRMLIAVKDDTEDHGHQAH